MVRKALILNLTHVHPCEEQLWAEIAIWSLKTCQDSPAMTCAGLRFLPTESCIVVDICILACSRPASGSGPSVVFQSKIEVLLLEEKRWLLGEGRMGNIEGRALATAVTFIRPPTHPSSTCPSTHSSTIYPLIYLLAHPFIIYSSTHLSTTHPSPTHPSIHPLTHPPFIHPST